MALLPLEATHVQGSAFLYHLKPRSRLGSAFIRYAQLIDTLLSRVEGGLSWESDDRISSIGRLIIGSTGDKTNALSLLTLHPQHHTLHLLSHTDGSRHGAL